MSTRLRRFSAAAAVAGVALVSLHASPATARAADSTCQGQAATIVLDSPGYYEGTDGPDVIVVTAPETEFRAGAGDDLICIDAAYRTNVNAGAGDDGVYVRDVSSYTKLWVLTLGPGDDTFVGGPGDDQVTGEPDGSPNYDPGFDRIDTRGGSDFVLVGTNGYGAHHVDVDLGEGRDNLGTYSDGVTADSTLLGGASSDRLELRGDAQGHTWVVDARAHTIDSESRVVSSWGGFERYSIGVWDGAVRFEGTAGNDEVSLTARRVDATMRGGDDAVGLSARSGDVQGGAGRDRIKSNQANVHINLARQEMVSRRHRVSITSFRDARTGSGKITGSQEGNTIEVACGTVHGGGGDDRIRTIASPYGYTCYGYVAYGGPGDDALRGTQGPDLLIGGTGRDVAYGLRGRDECRVERAHDCEAA